MKPEFIPLSKLYRKRCAQLELTEETRREINMRFGGARSSTDFNRDGWRAVLDELNRLVNEPTPAKFRRRSSHVSRFTSHPFPLDGCATPEQVDWIRDLEAKLPDVAVSTLIYNHAWPKKLRPEAEQWYRGNGSFESLPVKVASMALKILKRTLDARATRRASAAAPVEASAQ